MSSVRRVGQRVVAAADWAERVRPRWYVMWAALVVLGAALSHIGLMSLSARIAILGGLAFLYVLPLVVAVVRNFQVGLRGES